MKKKMNKWVLLSLWSIGLAGACAVKYLLITIGMEPLEGPAIGLPGVISVFFFVFFLIVGIRVYLGGSTKVKSLKRR